MLGYMSLFYFYTLFNHLVGLFLFFYWHWVNCTLAVIDFWNYEPVWTDFSLMCHVFFFLLKLDGFHEEGNNSV